MKKSIIVLFMLVFLVSSLFAQKKHKKYGKIDISNLEMTTYEKDTSANAVILFNYGEARFKWDNTDGFQFYQEFHIRIKILNKDGADWANREIIYSKKNEKINNLKAQSYNLKGGKIVKTKIKGIEFFEERYNSNYSIKKFTFPDVKAGTIIEYKYNITSNNLYNLDYWQFQYSIPVIYNEYEITIPEYLTYRRTLKGYLAPTEVKNSNTPETFTISGRTAPGAGGKIETYSYVKESDSQEYIYVMENIPAFKSEPYISSKYNYISILEFELLQIKYFNDKIDNITTSWEEVNKELLQNERFGKQSKCPNALKKELDLVTADKENDYDKMVAIYEFIKDKMLWNNMYGIFAKTTIKSAYNKGGGSVGDINLLLIAALKPFGINAIPIIISTRKNGFINTAYPSISDFNYVIAQVKIDDKIYYLDATDKYCPAGLLPERCLNGIGRAIYKATFEVDLTNTPKSDEAHYLTITITDDGIVGSYAVILKNYAALEYRNEYKNTTTEDKFLENIEIENEGMIISDFEIIDIDNIYKPLKIKYNIKISDKADILGDKIYIDPMLFFGVESNPFKIEKREYPVDFAYPLADKYTFTFTDYNVFC